MEHANKVKTSSTYICPSNRVCHECKYFYDQLDKRQRSISTRRDILKKIGRSFLKELNTSLKIVVIAQENFIKSLNTLFYAFKRLLPILYLNVC